MTQEKWRIFLNQSENMKSIQEILNISDYLNFRILWISEKIANLKKIEKKKKRPTLREDIYNTYTWQMLST